MYSLHTDDVNKVEVVTLNIHNPVMKFNVYRVTKEYLNILTMLMNYKHFQAKYGNNCPTRCNTKQSISYSASSLYIFRVSTTPIIRSTQNCNYSLRYCSCAATSFQRGQASLATLEGGRCTKNMTSMGGCSYSCVYSWWWVWLTPKTSRVNLQNNKQTALCCMSLDTH